MAKPNNIKPQRGLGSAITAHRRRQRDALRREREAREARRKDLARGELMRSRGSRRNAVKQDFGGALLASVADSQTAYLRSLSMRHRILTQVSHWDTDIKAWTDFTDVNVVYPRQMLKTETGDRLGRDATLDAIASVRGVIQHEIGHLRFTVPWPQLLRETYADARNYDADGNPCPLRDGGAERNAWNILEDQRMETLVVKAVPRISSYLTRMVYDHLLKEFNTNAWVLLAGRLYLPEDVRLEALRLYDETHASNEIKSSVWYDIVSRYKQATTAYDMYQIVIEATEFLESLEQHTGLSSPEAGTQHRHDENYHSPVQASQGSPSQACEPEDDEAVQSAMEQSSNSGQSSDSGDDSDDSEGDDSEGDDSGSGGDSDDDADDADSDSGADGDGASGADGDSEADGERPDQHVTEGRGEGRGDGNRQQGLRERIQEAMDDIATQHRGDRENRNMLAGVNERLSKKGLPELSNSGEIMSDDEVDQAMTVAVGVQNALAELVTISQPAWHSRQDAGVLDALAYRTKQVGSLDYHRRLEGNVNGGLDVHVSLLADISGSMSGPPIKHLSIGMYGMRKACEALGIGSTFVLWSSPNDTGHIWRTNPVEPIIWDADGGTQPIPALDDLDNHNDEDASQHLVILFTDGAFSGVDLRRYEKPGRHIVLMTIGRYDWDTDDYGADISINVDSCLDIPAQMAKVIMDINTKAV